MVSDNYAVIVGGLDKVDLLALESEVTETKLELRVLDEDEHKYGEPGTIIAIAAIGSVALPLILVWLARKKIRIDVTMQKEVELPDGTKVKQALTVTASGSGPPSPETLEKLAKFKVLSLNQLQDFFGNADEQG